MTATLRLFTIEARRSVALWFFPLMALVACWYANSRLTPIGVSLWRHNSTQIGETLLVLAPLMGGVAAWAAGRDRRRGIGDLLATTPRPLSHRALAGWGGTALWGVLAYAVVGAFVVVVSLWDDAWGSPIAAPVVIGLLAIVAAAAIGYLAGAVIPNRLVAPLVPRSSWAALATRRSCSRATANRTNLPSADKAHFAAALSLATASTNSSVCGSHASGIICCS
ncbi:MAG: hypothetical protein WD628_01900, partial [Thermomicrobiales bacterium]